jgi:uncharacterized protein YneR|tara:strand:+ start:205 stop:810 length:606 start_codon:yes stop_codon:yes gene_type:complete
MQSLFDFIVQPVGKRYDNEVKVGDKTLITNTKIESFKSVSNRAVVLEVPKAFETKIKKGDILIIHHNVFRRFYDIRGNQKDSRSKFTDDKFFCSIDQIYLYGKEGEWKSFGDRCFINPIVDNDDLTLDKEKKLIGILKYGNSSLEALEINPGDLVGYTPFGEFEFFIDNERLYCMKSNDIVIKYDKQGDEIKYNPSWAKSS